MKLASHDRLLRWMVLASWLLGLSACGDPPPDREAQKQRVAEYLQTFLVDRDWTQWPDYYGAQATINGSSIALQIMRGTADGLHFSFGDMSLRVVEQVAEPPRVATFFIIEGRHDRPFNDQPATRQQVRLDGFVIDRFENDKIVESRMFLDVWGLSRQAAALGRNSD